ncbi:ABC transporter ATP-binding protein [Nitratireductor rhodophyticola]|uniref:ABC transporter ATP-binding protein n=1 Tax=Nitratireductor rhodophyticola TaxID=2854036 RepID=UPI002AC8D0DD|nr:ABC transporter ATP-binding protein [Nitratireductor rhodophyticola]WPZ12483.1 ABC transporter ATP-binding protein [Nitratireductor rhodophyticola]
MSDETYLDLSDLTLAYGKTVAVESLNLSIRKGELIALLGPSGCGKTTTMRAITGLLRPASGKITLDGADITYVPANKRHVGLVFQSYALFPHLTVFENVAFGLRLKKLPTVEINQRVEAGLAMVGLSKFHSRKPAELSGGQQQRVALARSLVMEPKVLLLDEPLSNLDARLRLEMRTELQRVQRESGVTMVFVTHDQNEALALADRIVVMKEGAIEQVGSPEDVYNRPQSRFVADFVGFENIFPVEGDGIRTEAGAMQLSAKPAAGASGLAWRPNMVTLGEGRFEGEVLGAAFAGGSREYLLKSPLGPIKAEMDAAAPAFEPGSRIAFDLPPERAAVLQRM